MVKIAFFHKDLYERLGIMSISAVLKKNGHTCEVFCKDAEKNFIESILNYRPDVVTCGPCTTEHVFDLKILRELKEINPDLITVIGGHHATVYTDVIEEPHIDIMCIGEAEYSMLELMDSIEQSKNYNNVEGLWVKDRQGRIYKNPIRPLTENLDALPFPDRKIYYDKYKLLRSNPTKTFMASRGCPFQCSYCFNHYYQKLYKMKGKYVRYRSPENVIAEIKEVMNNYNLKWVQFHDSTFNSHYQYTSKFLNRYKNSNLPGFICNIRVENLDENLVKLMKESGCDKVTLGVECGDEDTRKNIFKRYMTNAQILSACALIKKYNIRLFTSNMVGLPNETVNDAFKTVEINRKINPEMSNCYVLVPFPKTDISDYCIENGYLRRNQDIDSLPSTNSNKSVVINKDINKLINIQKLFYYLVKYPKYEFFFRKLAYLPPNKLFSKLHDIPYHIRSIKYEDRMVRKFKLLFNILKD